MWVVRSVCDDRILVLCIEEEVCSGATVGWSHVESPICPSPSLTAFFFYFFTLGRLPLISCSRVLGNILFYHCSGQARFPSPDVAPTLA